MAEVGIVEYARVELRVPKTVLAALGQSSPEMVSDFARRIAVSLYAEGILSLGKAAEMAGLPYAEFMDLLRAKRIPLNYTVAELESDIQTLREVTGP